MTLWGIKRLFRFPTRTREDVRADIADELAFHLDMRTEALVREGLPEAEARAQAQREYGNRAASVQALARTGDQLERRRRFGRLFEELRQDTRQGLRLLGRSPGFAAVAILTLAIGIGANTAIYSVLDALLLRPLPLPEPERLVMVSETLENGNPNSVSGGAYLDWRTHGTSFEALTLTGRVSYNLRGSGTPERLQGLEVSHEFLRVLGVSPLLGRDFHPDEDRPGGVNDVVIVTEELWRTRFGADRDLVGRSIILDEVPRTVIGVLPAGTWLFKDDVFFVPAVLRPGTERASRARSLGRRLRPPRPGSHRRAGRRRAQAAQGAAQSGVPVLQAALGRRRAVGDRGDRRAHADAAPHPARRRLARAAHRLRQRREPPAGARLPPAAGARRARRARRRQRPDRPPGADRERRPRPGRRCGRASASRIVGVELLRAATSDILPFTFSPRVDMRVLLVSLAVTIVTGLFFGVLPALSARRPDLNRALGHGSKGVVSGGRQRTQATLIVVEVALTVVLLSAAGLLLRSLGKTASSDPGFEPARVLAFDVSLPDRSYESREKRLAFTATLLDTIRALPGVEGAGSGMAIPFSGGGYGEYIRRPDRPELRDEMPGRMDFVSPGYLEALGTRLLAGRRFTPADNRADGPRTAIISETTARRLFPDRSPLGQPIRISGDPAWTIVGVIADVVDRRLDADRRAFAYVPQAFNTSQISIAVRTSGAPLGLVRSVRGALQALDPGVAMANPRALDQVMAGSMLQRKAVLWLVGAFAVIALVAREHRPLRRHGLRGRHAPARVRHPDGARCRPERRDRVRPASRHAHDGDRPAARPRRCARRGPPARERALPGPQQRPDGHHRDDHDGDGDCAARLLGAGLARLALQSRSPSCGTTDRAFCASLPSRASREPDGSRGGNGAGPPVTSNAPFPVPSPGEPGASCTTSSSPFASCARAPASPPSPSSRSRSASARTRRSSAS